MVKISVIIPCYNQEKYIEEAIESVLHQTFKDFEIIVVNDGSSDNSLSIIKKYAEKYVNVISYINQSNQGVIAARNNAIAKSCGEYIFPLDGDDKIAPTCLQKLYDAMIKGKGDVICCEGMHWGSINRKFEYAKPTKFNMSLRNQVCVSALYKKEDWQKYGGYDEIMRAGLEDWDFWLNFIEDNKRFYRVKEVLFFYRTVNVSRNSKIDIDLRKQLDNIVKNKHKRLYNWYWKILYFLRISLVRFVFEKKITKSGRMLIKVFKIKIPLLKIQKEI